MISEYYQKLPGVVILVRHGQTDFNRERRFQGIRDIPLNSQGRAQATRAGEFIAGLCRTDGRSLRLGHLWSSDLNRALETANIIHKIITKSMINQAPFLNVSEDFREFHVGVFEGRTFADLEREKPETVKSYMEAFEADPEGTPYPEGESAGDVKKRMLTGFRPMEREILPDSLGQSSRGWHDRHLWVGRSFDIIVSHGGALTTLMNALGLSVNGKLGNCDCLIIGRFERSYQLLHHAEMS